MCISVYHFLLSLTNWLDKERLKLAIYIARITQTRIIHAKSSIQYNNNKPEGREKWHPPGIHSFEA